jgi:hypothetical protein
MFIPFEATQIQQIPLNIIGPKDVLIWSGTTNGHLSVKSAYELLWDEQHQSSELSTLSN